MCSLPFPGKRGVAFLASVAPSSFSWRVAFSASVAPSSFSWSAAARSAACEKKPLPEQAGLSMFGKKSSKSAAVNQAPMPALGTGADVVGAFVGVCVGSVVVGVGEVVGDEPLWVQKGAGHPWAVFAHHAMKLSSLHHALIEQSSWRTQDPSPCAAWPLKLPASAGARRAQEALG